MGTHLMVLASHIVTPPSPLGAPHGAAVPHLCFQTRSANTTAHTVVGTPLCLDFIR